MYALSYLLIVKYRYFNNSCWREWRMSNGGCTTERSCGYAI